MKEFLKFIGIPAGPGIFVMLLMFALLSGLKSELSWRADGGPAAK